MKKLILFLSAFAGAAFVSGCSVVAKIPMNRFESPETRGTPWKLEGQVAYQGRNEVSFTEDYRFSPPTLSTPSVDTPGHRLMAQGAVSMLERLDVSLTVPDSRLGLKYQIFGSPYESREEGGFPIAVYGGVGLNNEEESGSNLIQPTTSYYKLKETQFDIGLIFGYRASPQALIYSGPFVVWDNIRTTYRTNGGPAVDQQATSRSLGLNLGLQIDVNQAFFRLEGAGMKTRLGNADVGRGTYGIAGGVYF